MDRITIIISICISLIQSCSGQSMHKVQPEIFEFKNDTINQVMEVTNIDKDTLLISLNTINNLRSTSCRLEGSAIHDTLGDFLNEEETEDIENNEYMQVKRYTFLYRDSIPIFGIALDIINNDRLKYTSFNSPFSPSLPGCLLYSVGTLRKKTIVTHPK
jgi:hypothetical protein